MLERSPSVVRLDGSAWRDLAKCKDRGPDMFIPRAGGSTAKAQAFCKGLDDGDPCPVRISCYQYAKENSCIGVWGGEVFSTRSFRARAGDSVESEGDGRQ
jgi:hypothetical protein